MPERTGEELFGPGNTWWDVREYVLKFLRQHSPGIRKQAAEDAASEGLIRTMELWVNWKSSILPDDPDLTFRGAKRNAVMEAQKCLKRERARSRVEVTTSDRQLLAREEAIAYAASTALASLEGTKEWDRWARDLVAGLTERASAAAHGVTQQAIHNRRKRGMEKLQDALRR